MPLLQREVLADRFGDQCVGYFAGKDKSLSPHSEQLFHRMAQLAEVNRAVGGGVEWLRTVDAELVIDRGGIIFRRIRMRDDVASVAI